MEVGCIDLQQNLCKHAWQGLCCSNQSETIFNLNQGFCLRWLTFGSNRIHKIVSFLPHFVDCRQTEQSLPCGTLSSNLVIFAQNASQAFRTAPVFALALGYDLARCRQRLKVSLRFFEKFAHCQDLPSNPRIPGKPLPIQNPCKPLLAGTSFLPWALDYSKYTRRKA